MDLQVFLIVNIVFWQYLEPVWIVSATDEIRGRSIQLYVPAEADVLSAAIENIPLKVIKRLTQPS